jgi:hypothetical protein
MADNDYEIADAAAARSLGYGYLSPNLEAAVHAAIDADRAHQGDVAAEKAEKKAAAAKKAADTKADDDAKKPEPK